MPTPSLDAVELSLQSPIATGIFLTEIRGGSAAERAGLNVGDIVTAVSGVATPDMRTFIEALQPSHGDSRELLIALPGGALRAVSVPAGTLGVAGCTVRERECGWRIAADSAYVPDLSTFCADGSIWLRTSFGGEPAGYERVLLKREGDFVTLDHLTHFGGQADRGRTWAYRAHVISTHRLDRCLTTVAMASRFGTPEEGVQTARLELGRDGQWHGESTGASGERREIHERPATVEAINSYAVPFLTLTMPLRAGARLTFPELLETQGRIRGRCRLECLGRFEVPSGGVLRPAWCFALRHYGEGDDFERFYVDDARRLVRIEWGANYAGCVCEAVARKEIGKDLPEHIKVE